MKKYSLFSISLYQMQMTEKHNAKENDNKKSVQKIKISFQPNDECVYGDIPQWFTMFPSLCRDQ